MRTIELKEELHKFIDTEDETFVRKLYESAKTHLEQKKHNKMIAEGEADIKAGRLHPMSEVKSMIDNWKKG